MEREDIRAGAEQKDHTAAERAPGYVSLRGSISTFVRIASSRTYSHQRMGESDFGTVYGAIPGGFEDGEVVCESWIEDYSINRILYLVLYELKRRRKERAGRNEAWYLQSVHGDQLGFPKLGEFGYCSEKERFRAEKGESGN